MYKELVFIPGGYFLMGDTAGDFSRESRPVHKVKITGFYIGKYPVTRGFWAAVMDNNTSNSSNSACPGVMVSWFDAINFCNRLSVLHSLAPCYELPAHAAGRIICYFGNTGYRLPTEAEWEYAARGGAKTSSMLYAGSSNIDEVAWYKNNSRGALHETGLKKPNTAGLYDMCGNAWEWCWDWYGKYPAALAIDPVGPSTGTTRIYRGGSFLDFAYGCTVAVRGRRTPRLKQADIGFRIAQSTRQEN